MEKRLVTATFYKFFFPTLASSVVLSVISMTDLIIAGHFVGENALTAISLALPVIIFIQIVSALCGMGGAIVLSARLGEGNLEACSRVFTVSIVLAAGTGLVVSILGTVFLEPVILLLGGTAGPVMELARQYIGTLIIGMVFMILSPVMVTFLRNDSRQGYSMFAVVSGSVFNIICSLLFVTAFDWGIAGIARATVLSQLLTCVLAGRKLFFKNHNFHLTGKAFSVKLVLEILKPGSTVATIFFCQVLLTVFINHVLMLQGGKAGVAVYAVVKYLLNFLYALFDGVTGAVQPMLGIYYGEKEKKNVTYTAASAFKTMCVMALIMFFLMEFLGDSICVLFGVEGRTLWDMTVKACQIEGLYCIVAAFITFLNGFYRCTGNEKLSFLLSLSDNLLFPVFSIFLITKLTPAGVDGVWLGLLAGSLCTLVLWGILCVRRKRGILMLRSSQFEEDEQEYHVIIPARKDEMEMLFQGVEQYCDRMEVSPKRQYYITLAIEELVVNVIGLAGTDQKKWGREKEYYADIKIVPLSGGRARLRIRDNLTEWNPAELCAEGADELARLDENSAVNELGIGMVKKIAEEYSYRRTIGFNNFSVVL